MLDSSTQLLPSVLEHLSQPVMILDPSGTVRTANGAARELTGVVDGDIGRLPLWELAVPEDRTTLQALVLGKAEVEAPVRCEFRACRPGCPPAPQLWALSRNGASPWIILTPDAAALTTRRREFLSHAGHELRNPLSSILAFAEALQEEIHGPLNPGQKSSMQAIRENVQRALDLVSQFIDLGQVQTGALSLSPAQVPLEEVMQAALKQVEHIARPRSMQIKASVQPAGAALNADAGRLTQVVAEMLYAGALACQVGASLTLELVPSADGSALEIRMIGGLSHHLASAARPAIMDEPAKKARARVARLRPIGTAMLEELVRQHRGALNFQASADGGIGMSVLLHLQSLAAAPPATEPATAPQTRKPLLAEPAAAVTPGSTLILLADDQQALASITGEYLESIGLRVVLAADGQEAVQKAFELRPDLIMMDVQMPVMDGLEATRRIRQSSDSRLAQVPIISLSGLAVSGDMEKCLAAGASAYLAKPFGVQQLYQAVKEFVPLP